MGSQGQWAGDVWNWLVGIGRVVRATHSIERVGQVARMDCPVQGLGDDFLYDMYKTTDKTVPGEMLQLAERPAAPAHAPFNRGP